MARVILVCILGACLYPLISSAGSLSVSLIAFSVLTLGTIATTNDRSFSRPTPVFALFLFPYSTWFAFSLMAGPGYRMLYAAPNWAALTESINLAYLGLLSFTLVGAIIGHGRQASVLRPEARARWGAAVLIPSSAIIGAAVFQVAVLGMGSKRDVVQAGGYLIDLVGPAGFVVATGLVLIGLNCVRTPVAILKLPSVWIGVVALALGVVVLGERDLLFRAVALSMIVYFDHTRQATLPLMIAILAMAIVMLPITQEMKAVLLSGDFKVKWDTLLLGEFVSAGRNLYHLIDNGVEHSFGYLWADVARGLTPMGNALGLRSTSSWFDNVYRIEHNLRGTGAGWGFGLVAQGFLIGRETGVIVLFGLVSAVLHVLHILRRRSVFWFAFYALALTTAIYCIRADFANFTSQVFKIGGMSVLLYFVANKGGQWRSRRWPPMP